VRGQALVPLQRKDALFYLPDRIVPQFPASLGTTLAAKAIILLTGWLVAWMPGLFAIALWHF
jgi:hypothetical protein